MSLNNIPADPEPTDSELAKTVQQQASKILRGDPPDIERFARFVWAGMRREQEPDAVHVAFSIFVQVFPDGAPDYQAYLATSLWNRIRMRVLRAASGKCACCPKPATQVHHRDYRPRVLRGEDDSPLVALCSQCHEMVDKTLKGKSRLSWNKKEAILATMFRRGDRRLAPLTIGCNEDEAASKVTFGEISRPKPET
jgi:hypothetical protein